MSLEAMRGAKGSTTWSGPGFDPRKQASSDGVTLRCDITYGPGMTEVQFKVTRAEFTELALLMARVDRESAARAFGLALAETFEEDGVVTPSGS